jgi:hypothetical protein
MTHETSCGNDRFVRRTGVHAHGKTTVAAQRDDRVMASSGADQKTFITLRHQRASARIFYHNREIVMADINQIKKNAEVIGADGVHVGTVDHVDGKRLKLTKKDSSDDHHHYRAKSNTSVTPGSGEMVHGGVVPHLGCGLLRSPDGTCTCPAVTGFEGFST